MDDNIIQESHGDSSDDFHCSGKIKHQQADARTERIGFSSQ